MIFEITEYRAEENDYVAILNNNRQVILDPFVSCVFSYEEKEKHIGKTYKDDGKSSEHTSGVFVPRVLKQIESSELAKEKI